MKKTISATDSEIDQNDRTAMNKLDCRAIAHIVGIDPAVFGMSRLIP
jgi:precorrin-3B methylase